MLLMWRVANTTSIAVFQYQGWNIRNLFGVSVSDDDLEIFLTVFVWEVI